MTRDEHVEWCKQRAREYLDRGDAVNAVASMLTDMSDHPECHVDLFLTQAGLMAARDGDVQAARRFVEGFR